MAGSSTRGVMAALAGVLICAPAVADTPPPAPKTTQDPSEVVCEKQPVLGSRIQTKRVCMTRSQWADVRSQDRQEIDKVQTRRGSSGQ